MEAKSDDELIQTLRTQIEEPTRSNIFNLVFNLSKKHPRIFLSFLLSVLVYIFKDSPFSYSYIGNILSVNNVLFSVFFTSTLYKIYPVLFVKGRRFINNTIVLTTILLFVSYIVTSFLLLFYKVWSTSYYLIFTKNPEIFFNKIQTFLNNQFNNFASFVKEISFDFQANPELAADLIHDIKLAMNDTIADGLSFILVCLSTLSENQMFAVNMFLQNLKKGIKSADDKLFVEGISESYEDIKRFTAEQTETTLNTWIENFWQQVYYYTGTELSESEKKREEKEEEEVDEFIRELKRLSVGKKFDKNFETIVAKLLKRSGDLRQKIYEATTTQEIIMYKKELASLSQPIKSALRVSNQLAEAQNIKAMTVQFISDLEISVRNIDKYNIDFYNFVGGLDAETGQIVNTSILEFKKILQDNFKFQSETQVTLQGKIVEWIDVLKCIKDFVLQGDSPFEKMRIGGNVILSNFLNNLDQSNFVKNSKFLNRAIKDQKFKNLVDKFDFEWNMIFKEVSVTLSGDRYQLIKDINETIEYLSTPPVVPVIRKTSGIVAGVIEGTEKATGLNIINIEDFSKYTIEYYQTLATYADSVRESLKEKTHLIAKNYRDKIYIPEFLLENEPFVITAQSTNLLDSPATISFSLTLPFMAGTFFVVFIIMLMLFRKFKQIQSGYRFEDDTENKELDDIVKKINIIFH